MEKSENRIARCFLGMAVAFILPLAHAEARLVVCAKGKKVLLRQDSCRGKEARLKLGPDALELPATSPSLPTPPTCGPMEVLTWTGSAFQCVEDEIGDDAEVGTLVCTTEISVGNASQSGTFTAYSPRCPENTLVTGGGFFFRGTPPPGFVFKASKRDPNTPDRWLCGFVNPTNSAVEVECLVHCCAVE